MHKQKLCLGLSTSFHSDLAELVSLIKQAGFEAVFIDDCRLNAPVEDIVKKAKDENMIIQSYHAPFNKSDDMWRNDDSGELAKKELLTCLETCAKYELPIMVTHAFIGYDDDFVNTELGIERYAAVARRAAELGVKFAVENTEGQEFLAILMNSLKSEKALGFCWDSGHELCYNYGEDMLELYGDKLICTHLNDNLGVSSFEGIRTYTDDLHLLPFDGITDWDAAAKRLVNCGFNGILTFELSRQSKPQRHDNDKYAALSPEDYLAAAYARACRVAALKNKYERIAKNA